MLTIENELEDQSKPPLYLNTVVKMPVCAAFNCTNRTRAYRQKEKEKEIFKQGYLLLLARI